MKIKCTNYRELRWENQPWIKGSADLLFVDSGIGIKECLHKTGFEGRGDLVALPQKRYQDNSGEWKRQNLVWIEDNETYREFVKKAVEAVEEFIQGQEVTETVEYIQPTKKAETAASPVKRAPETLDLEDDIPF